MGNHSGLMNTKFSRTKNATALLSAAACWSDATNVGCRGKSIHQSVVFSFHYCTEQ